MEDQDNLRIQCAMDWPKIEIELKRSLREIGYNRDLDQMFKTLSSEITQLSKLEVDARRTKDVRICRDQLVKVNEILTSLEQWMLIAALSR